MHFLITGGAGFLGAHLANRLADDGHHVRVVDDLSSGDRDHLSRDVHFHRGDINNIPFMWSMLQDIDCVYHLAARVSVAQSILYPRDYNDANVGGTVSVMEAMRDAGVRRVVLASSGAIYGDMPQQTVSEEMIPNPDSPYAVSKWAAEQYVHTIGHLWGIETVALRIFNAYGPRQSLPLSHAPVVPRFLRQALGGGSLVLFGDGLQTRDFIYVSDVVAALVVAAQASGVDREVINVGSGRETTIVQLADLVEEATSHKTNRVFNTSKSGGVRRLVANISRARGLLAWEPQVTLAEGLARTIAEDQRFQAQEAPLPR